MTDSFFTGRNDFDRQVAAINAANCEQIIEASVRRIATLEGPFQAAIRVQRIADICAGAHLLPIELWQKIEPAKAPESPPEPAPVGRTKRLLRILQDSAGTPYWFGLLTGYLIGSS